MTTQTNILGIKKEFLLFLVISLCLLHATHSQKNELSPEASNDAGVLFNNRPVNPTLAPFLPRRTTPTPQFLTCIQSCLTTSEQNPVCASNREQYGNEQKFNCARNCGLDITIVRRGSCRGLVPRGNTGT